MDSPAAEVATETVIDSNETVVEVLYMALARGDTGTVSSLLATDLEWWFHGPPLCQHMMWVLTGESTLVDFEFKPRSIKAIGDRVFAEGWEGAHEYWVHVWTLNNGVITHFREYFNTWLVVQDLRPMIRETRPKGSTLWQSEPREHSNRTLPALLLAI